MSEADSHASMVAEMTSALAAGQKIMAIKIYRDSTGASLRDAKDFVDELIPRLIEEDPERFEKLVSSRGGGCGTAILSLVVMLATGVAAYWTIRG